MVKACKKCEKDFYPIGKKGKICEVCQAKSHSLRMARNYFDIRLDRIFNNIEQGHLKTPTKMKPGGTW